MDLESNIPEYRKKLYGYFLKYTKLPSIAEDFTQDVLIKLWKNREKFDHIENHESYMFSMARNHIIDHFNKMAREESYLTEYLKRMEEHDMSYETSTDNKIELMNKSVQRLSARQKEILTQRYQNQKSIKEIAALLNISNFTVRNHLAMAVKNVKKKIEGLSL